MSVCMCLCVCVLTRVTQITTTTRRDWGSGHPPGQFPPREKFTPEKSPEKALEDVYQTPAKNSLDISLEKIPKMRQLSVTASGLLVKRNRNVRWILMLHERTFLRAVMPCSWGVNAGMFRVWVAGKTV